MTSSARISRVSDLGATGVRRASGARAPTTTRCRRDAAFDLSENLAAAAQIALTRNKDVT
jgi:hypothetical protein